MTFTDSGPSKQAFPPTYAPACPGDPIRDASSPTGGAGGGPSPIARTPAAPASPVKVVPVRDARVLVRFIAGTLNPPDAPVSLGRVDVSVVVAEAETEKDVLVFEGICDDVHRVGQKSIRFLQWLQESEDAGLFTYDFAGLADDDAFIRLNAVLGELDSVPTTRLYWGNAWEATAPKYWSFHLQFMVGQLYVLSRDVVHWVANSSIPFKVDMMPGGDVVMGAHLVQLALDRRHDPGRFHDAVGRGGNGLELSAATLSVHHIDIEDMEVLKTRYGRLDTAGDCGAIAGWKPGEGAAAARPFETSLDSVKAAAAKEAAEAKEKGAKGA